MDREKTSHYAKSAQSNEAELKWLDVAERRIGEWSTLLRSLPNCSAGRLRPHCGLQPHKGKRIAISRKLSRQEFFRIDEKLCLLKLGKRRETEWRRYTIKNT